MSPSPERVNELPSREEVARLLHACRNGSRNEQLAALERIESLELAEAAPAVVEALSSGDEGVRLSAADAPGRLGADASEVAGPALIAALDDAESLVRSCAAAALGLLGYRPAARTVGELLENDPDAVVRADAAETLGDIGDAGSLSALEAALDDPDEPVRGYAASSLGLLGGPRAKEILDRAYARQAAPRVRVGLAVARYRLGERSALADVPRYVGSGDEDLATVALNELEFLLDRDPPSSLRDDMEQIRITLEEASQFPILRSQVESIRRRINRSSDAAPEEKP
jgi:HEAT repeat protein